jgi:hypothetical protein
MQEDPCLKSVHLYLLQLRRANQMGFHAWRGKGKSIKGSSSSQIFPLGHGVLTAPHER